MNQELSELEFRILDSLYFVEPFDRIVEECGEKPAIVSDVIEQLIHKKWIVPMRWDEEKADFVRSYMYDRDDLNAFSYMATKEGLMAHNSK